MLQVDVIAFLVDIVLDLFPPVITHSVFYILSPQRPCGISLGHVECISSESCTAFQLLLFELFGEYPETKDLAGVVIDRGINLKLTQF